MLPDYIKTYFWDTDADKLDAQKQSHYIIERLLEQGDTKAAAWMHQTYGRDRVVDILKSSRSLSKRTANYWALVFSVPKNDIRCFSKQFRTLSRPIWKR